MSQALDRALQVFERVAKYTDNLSRKDSLTAAEQAEVDEMNNLFEKLDKAPQSRSDAAEFKESEHPRASDGRFGNKAGNLGIGESRKSESLRRRPETYTHPETRRIAQSLNDKVDKALRSKNGLEMLRALKPRGVNVKWIQALIKEVEDEGGIPRESDPSWKEPGGEPAKAEPKPVAPPPPKKVEPAKPQPEPKKVEPAKPQPTPPAQGEKYKVPKRPDTTHWRQQAITDLNTLEKVAGDENKSVAQRLAFVKGAMAKADSQTYPYIGELLTTMRNHIRKAPPPTFKDVADAFAKKVSQHTHMSGAEQRYMLNSFADCKDNKVLGAIVNCKVVQITRSPDRNGAYYSPSAHLINMGSPPDTVEGQVIWRHEYGHAIDFNGITVNSSSAYENNRVRESKDLLDSTDKIGKAGPQAKDEIEQGLKEKYHITPEEIDAFCKRETSFGSSRLRLILSDVLLGSRINDQYALQDCVAPRSEKEPTANREDACMMLDFFGAFTENKIGQGHSNEYYKANPRRHTSEMFANYVALTGSSHSKIYRAILHKAAPTTCFGFAQILEDRAKGI